MSFSHWTRIIDNMNYLYYEHKSSQVCTVKEDERMYHACLSTHNYLNEMCLMNGSSLKGRQEAFIYQMKTKKFIPVVVNISKHEVYFPTKSKKAHDCIWINYANIQNVMYRSFKYLQFFLCFIGKIQLFFIHFLCSLFHIAGMVGNPLKITDAM